MKTFEQVFDSFRKLYIESMNKTFCIFSVYCRKNKILLQIHSRSNFFSSIYIKMFVV